MGEVILTSFGMAVHGVPIVLHFYGRVFALALVAVVDGGGRTFVDEVGELIAFRQQFLLQALKIEQVWRLFIRETARMLHFES